MIDMEMLPHVTFPVLETEVKSVEELGQFLFITLVSKFILLVYLEYKEWMTFIKL